MRGKGRSGNLRDDFRRSLLHRDSRQKLAEQEKVNRSVGRACQELSIPVVATNDCHYGERADFHAHDVLLCVQTGKTVSDDNRLKIETDELYLKSADEMNQGFDYCPGAVERTLEIADRCNVDIDSQISFSELYNRLKRSAWTTTWTSWRTRGWNNVSRASSMPSSERVMWSGSNTSWT